MDSEKQFGLFGKDPNPDYSSELLNPEIKHEFMVRRRIEAMRKLQESRGLHYRKTDKEMDVFILQGKYMEDYEDSYNREVPFIPRKNIITYNSMNDDELRTYFSWRTNARKGIIKKTSLAYVYLYVYELINNIGVSGPVDAIHKLIFIWKQYGKINSGIQEQMREWVKDYYICNDFASSFKDIIETCGLQKYYPRNFLSGELIFENLLELSNCDFSESEFYSGEYRNLFGWCFDTAMAHLAPLFSLYGIDLHTFIFGNIEKTGKWEPFAGALYRKIPGEHKNVILGAMESYCYADGAWTRKTAAGSNPAAPEFIEYIIKRIESRLSALTESRDIPQYNKDALLRAIEETGIYYLQYKTFSTVIRSEELFESILTSAADECFRQFTGTGAPADSMLLLPEAREIEKYQDLPLYPALKEVYGIVCRDLNERFSLQAARLSSLEDTFNRTIPYKSSIPCYSGMTISQLRCFISWRTRAGKNEFPDTEVSYIILYISELINNTPGLSSGETLEKISTVFHAYKHSFPSLEKLVPPWVRDYYICNPLDGSFTELAQKYGFEKYFPELFAAANCHQFILYNKLSNYSIYESPFYTDGTAPMIHACFNFTLKKVTALCRANDYDIHLIMKNNRVIESPWQPFKNAYYFERNANNIRNVSISNYESYVYSRSEQYCEIFPGNNPVGVQFASYLLKRIESKLRKLTGFRQTLNPTVKQLSKVISANQLGHKPLWKMIYDDSLDKVIDNSVTQFFNKFYPRGFSNPAASFREPTEVKIDTSLLEKIRDDADEIRDKLIVAEASPMDIQEAPFPGVIEPDRESTNAKNPPSGGWDGFFLSLTEIDKRVLSILLSGKNTRDRLIALSKDNGSMMEVMLEEINEKSLDSVNDTVIDTGNEAPCIFEAYIYEIRKMQLEGEA